MHTPTTGGTAPGQSVPAGPTGARGVREQVKLRRPGEIITAAYEEFSQNGFAATRLEDVARRIGVTKGTIYIYFQSKEELFRAVVRSLSTPILDRAAEFTASFSGSSAELLRQHLQNMYRDICSDPHAPGLLRLLIAEGAKFPELVDFYHREVVDRALQIISNVLTRGVARGEFRADVPIDHPQIYTAPILMLAIDKMMRGTGTQDEVCIESHIDAHIKIVLAALCPMAAI